MSNSKQPRRAAVPHTPSLDLHDKLIKEIHNKSLERSRKDQTICLDERGNLIGANRNHQRSSMATAGELSGMQVPPLRLRTGQSKYYKVLTIDN